MSTVSDATVCSIERARRADLDALGEIERRAAARFPGHLLPPSQTNETLDPARLGRAIEEGRVFVARLTPGAGGASGRDATRGTGGAGASTSARVVGFALVRSFETAALLEEIDVDPDWGRRGLGGRLLEAACDWAAAAGHPRIVLSTFRDVAWNAPFYARRGFREVAREDWTSEMQREREAEVRGGLDGDARVWMERASKPSGG